MTEINRMIIYFVMTKIKPSVLIKNLLMIDE